MATMQKTDWDSFLQLTSEGSEGMLLDPGKVTPVAEITERAALQLPTPTSELNEFNLNPSDEPPQESTSVAVSTSFFPGANNDPSPRDLILLSDDAVFFYVHSHVLRQGTMNGFKGQLEMSTMDSDGQSTVLSLPVRSTVLNVALHTIHSASCAHYCPTFEDINDAIAFLDEYGFSLPSLISPSRPLYTLFLSHAPLRPIDVYATAAHYNLQDLAVASSPHLLSFSLPSLTDEHATRMGSLYLKRLFFLHVGRVDALKRILLPPPHQHPPTLDCSFSDQKGVTRAWALASSYLVWDARPDLSVGSIESALKPLGDHLSCEFCQKGLRDRIRDLVIQWSSVKRTI